MKQPGLSFKTLQEDVHWEDLLGMWLEADTIDGLEGGWLFDHFYPIYGDHDGPCFEGWTALSYLAGRIKRLRLGLLVSANPYRHPAVLANMAATFDVFSEGRLNLGIGAGWFEVEAAAYGIEFPPLGERLDRLEEACAVISSLLSQDETNFNGKHYQLKKAYCQPKPLQQSGIPIVIGGKGEKRTLKIAARFANEWNFPGGSAEELAHRIGVLHRHCRDLDRDPSEIRISAHIRVKKDLAETVRISKAYVAAGAEHLCLYFYDCTRPAAITEAVEAVLSDCP